MSHSSHSARSSQLSRLSRSSRLSRLSAPDPILRLCRGRGFGILIAMAKIKFLVLAAACAVGVCRADVADYCREVVEPAIAGVFAVKWTLRGPDAEAVAAVCTNVDWRIVRKRRSRQREVWIGGTVPEGGTPWRLGVSRATGGTFLLDGRLWPFESSPCAVTNSCATNAHVRVVARAESPAAAVAPLAAAKRLVAQAYALRQERKFPEASKTLRAAEACDPLDAWNLVERLFLEEEGEGAVDAAREGRARPDESVSACRAAYLQIGATNEVRLIDRQLKQKGGK